MFLSLWLLIIIISTIIIVLLPYTSTPSYPQDIRLDLERFN